MSERNPEALHAALAIFRDTRLLKLVRSSALPRGVTLLLEAAAGEPDAIGEAQRATGAPEAQLTEAAGFFVEQVLLNRSNNSYRILGADRDASAATLRRHMALILKWLHPDLAPASEAGQPFSKSAFATLVTGAWELIKTDERRSAYDASLTSRHKPANRTASDHGRKTPGGHIRPLRRRTGQLAVYKLERDTFWVRLLSYLGRLK